jgi:ClpP class serine protease
VSFNLTRAILSGVWMIDPLEAEKYLPLVARFISGEATFSEQHDPELKIIVQGAVMASASQVMMADAPKGVTAIIPITGPILKYSAMCGPRGLDYYSELLSSAASDPNINSILLLIDSGGGQAFGIQSFTAQVSAISKPSLSLIHDGIGASAAYWIASSTNQGIWATTKSSVVGSIGTMLTLADMKGKMEKDGVKLHEIYASKSTNKNKDIDDALKGDYKAVRSSLLDPLNETFISSVKASRGDKITNEEVFTGKTYMADKAMEMGLIDQIGSVQEAVDYLQSLVKEKPGKIASKSTQIQSINHNQTTMKFKSAWASILAVIGFGAVTSEDEAPVVTEERLEQLNGSLESANQRIEDLTSQVTKLQGDLKSTNDALATAEQERDAFKVKAEKLGKQAGASHHVPNEGKPEGGNDEAPKSEQEQFVGYAHNKEALEDISKFS